MQDGDVTITDPTAISNSFNDYFTSIADKILEKRKYEGPKSFRDFLSNRMTENFVFKECDENEIKLIISSLDVAKSSGPNSIPTHMGTPTGNCQQCATKVQPKWHIVDSFPVGIPICGPLLY